jgi:hypothetical protein
VSRTLLTLYALDRAGLAAFTAELRETLALDDRAKLAEILGLGEALAARLRGAGRAVDLLLRPEDDAEAGPIFASLRRVAKRRALERVWTSEAPSLEGRLRAFDVLRDDEEIAAGIDRLLSVEQVPWFLRRPGATTGWLDEERRSDLADRLARLGPALPEEVNAFAEGLALVDGDVLIHDQLEFAK